MTAPTTEPLTHSDPNVDRRYRTCRCSKCQVVAQCLPLFDFYGNDGEPLTCETCFAKSHGLPMMGSPEAGGTLQ